MRVIISIFILGMCLSCSSTKTTGLTSNSYAKILEAGDKLYAFRMPIDSISKCFFKEYNDLQLINHYINYDKINGNEEPKVLPRKVTKRNISGMLKIGFNNQENTKIVAKVSIDKIGRVIAAELLEETTAILSREKRRKVLAEFLAYQYQGYEDATCIESGTITITLTNIKTLN
jgi:hypothetical protein